MYFLLGYMVHVKNIVAKRKYCLCKMKEYLEMLDVKASVSDLIFDISPFFFST